ncbi:GNAT family N-acetyltransferase [Streptomyces sp. NPDC006172]|uniref:GNAT family N-acetyltransferase n=1 Tax=Streptomyces sp. NPDC006172 TaxID=3154470 RepID=UPI0033F15957
MSDQRHVVVVRTAELADVEALVACSSALFGEDAGTRDPSVDVHWPREHGSERFAAGIDDPDRLLLVADREGQVVGYLTGAVGQGSAMRPVRVASLVSMYVLPACRRERIGERLVGAFTAWAKEREAQLVEVTAYSSNSEAVRFYERNGFAAKSVTLERAL